MKKGHVLLIIISLLLLSCNNKKSITPVEKGNIVDKNAKRKLSETTTLTNTFALSSGKLEKQYYIIGGSFRSKKRAELFSKQLYRKGYPSKVLYRQGRNRVTLQSFTDKTEAIRELKRLRKLNQNPHFWLLRQ